MTFGVGADAGSVSRSFRVRAPYAPAGDQPAAIEALTRALDAGTPAVTLLGITGSGKSATVAWTIEHLGRPTLVIAPNKSLAAQLASEFASLLPDNHVELFVSYYDYYRSEAYLPTADVFVDKEAARNVDIDRLRHATTATLARHCDVVVVASISCIYGLGPPAEYADRALRLVRGAPADPRRLAARLVAMGYVRSDMLVRGDQRRLDPERLGLGRDRDPLHPGGGDHRRQPGVGGAHVGRQPGPEVLGLADVQHPPGPVVEQVRARRGRDRRGVERNRHARDGPRRPRPGTSAGRACVLHRTLCGAGHGVRSPSPPPAGGTSPGW